MPGLEKVWWALRDSNPEPRDYESILKTVFKCGNVNISVDSSGLQILLYLSFTRNG